MTTELAVREDGSVPAVSWTHEQVELIKRTIAVNATHDELQLFLYQAKRTGLDPLSRQIHFVKRKDKGTIQTAIDGYRLIADRTGKYAGSDDYLFDEGIPQYLHMVGKNGVNPVTATVTVYKMVDGSKVAFTATAGWGEYFPGEVQGFMWKKMPYLMIGKCAEALALRKAFPAELSGIYTNEEMQQADAGPTPSPQPRATVGDEWHIPNYGPDAGQPFSAVKTDHLKDYLAGAERSIKDPKKANFLQKNEQMRDALVEEIAKRERAAPSGQGDGAGSTGGERPSLPHEVVGTQQASDALASLPGLSTGAYLLTYPKELKGQRIGDISEVQLNWLATYYNEKLSAPANAQSVYRQEWEGILKEVWAEQLRRDAPVPA